MPLETANFIDGLVASNPDGADQRGTADDHIRLVKAAVKASFSAVAGEVSASHLELNRTKHLSQLDSDMSATAGELNALALMTTTGRSLLQASSADAALSVLNVKNVVGRMVKTTDQALTPNTWTRVTWNRASAVTGGGNYDTANAVFQPRTAGQYLCTWSAPILSFSAGGVLYTSLEVPTATAVASTDARRAITQAYTPSTLNIFGSGSAIVDLSAGSMLSVLVMIGNVASSHSVSGASFPEAHFEITRIGNT